MSRSPEDQEARIQYYKSEVIRRLKGEGEGFEDVRPGRLEWEGVSSVMNMYGSAAGEDRTAMISAMGGIIREGEPVDIVAETIDLASSLDLAELQPNVEAVLQKPLPEDSILRDAATQYLAYREARVRLAKFPDK